MKKIDSFISNRVFEYRTPGSTNKKSSLDGVDVDKLKGKDAEKNGTDGKMGVDEPTDDSAVVDIPEDEWNDNIDNLTMKFEAEDDFFIIGEAGWAKTSIIKRLAKKYGYEVRTFYLDKMEAIDLGGQDIPTKDPKTGRPMKVKLPPSFTNELADNPDKKFLLFFDEMNQATPDVLNALMPIVLEHEIAGEKFGKKDSKGKVIESNFFCGGAGNFESENEAVNELPGPLKSRFKPLIVWQKDWKSTFSYFHKKWDKKLGKAFIDELEKYEDIFENPRELEHKLIERYVYKFKQTGFKPKVTVWQSHLERLVKENLSRTQQDSIPKLAEYIFDYLANDGKEEKGGSGEGRRGSRGSEKDMNMIPKNLVEAIKFGMEHGYIEDKNSEGKKVKYGISRENIFSVEESMLNAEMMERLINKLEADGTKFKYEKNEEWQKAGYHDPNEED